MTDAYLSTSLDDIFVPHPVVGMVWEHRSTSDLLVVMRSAMVVRIELCWHPQETGARLLRAGWMVSFAGFADPEYWAEADDKRALLPLDSTVRPSVSATLHFRIQRSWPYRPPGMRFTLAHAAEIEAELKAATAATALRFALAEALSLPIDELPFNIRTANGLQSANIKYLYELVEKTEDDLCEIRQLARKCAAHADRELRIFGKERGIELHLGMTLPPDFKRLR